MTISLRSQDSRGPALQMEPLSAYIINNSTKKSSGRKSTKKKGSSGRKSTKKKGSSSRKSTKKINPFGINPLFNFGKLRERGKLENHKAKRLQKMYNNEWEKRKETNDAAAKKIQRAFKKHLSKKAKQSINVNKNSPYLLKIKADKIRKETLKSQAKRKKDKEKQLKIELKAFKKEEINIKKQRDFFSLKEKEYTKLLEEISKKKNDINKDKSEPLEVLYKNSRERIKETNIDLKTKLKIIENGIRIIEDKLDKIKKSHNSTSSSGSNTKKKSRSSSSYQSNNENEMRFFSQVM